MNLLQHLENTWNSKKKKKKKKKKKEEEEEEEEKEEEEDCRGVEIAGPDRQILMNCRSKCPIFFSWSFRKLHLV